MAATVNARFLEAGDRNHWFRMWRGYQKFYQIKIENRNSEIT